MKFTSPPTPYNGRRAEQRGVVLLFSLIALTIMLIVAVALVRSFNSSLFTAGNIGFKRDLQNQSEAAISQALQQFRTGGNLSTVAGRQATNTSINYSASILPTNAEGIPNDLILSETDFAARYSADQTVGSNGSVKYRYLIDRLCVSPGDETTLGAGNCRLADNPVPTGTSLSNLQGAERTIQTAGGAGGKGAAPQSVLYRVSVRVSGPRNTQSFFQSTFTAPSS